jgi:hypothetical protein
MMQAFTCRSSPSGACAIAVMTLALASAPSGDAGRSAGPVAAAATTGPVRIDGRALADDQGAFTALGATLFWGAWGYRHDRARLERNLAFLAEHGVDAVRVLGTVGPGETWDDRSVDPAWPDYDDVVTGLTDLAYDRYGLRVQWTIFGGVGHTPAPDARAALVDRIRRLLEPRAAKVLFVEIANEGYQNGFDTPEGLAELRRLGESLAAKSPLLVALTAPQNGPDATVSAEDVYGGAGVDVATLHHDRDISGDEGAWRPARVPWTVIARRPILPPILASNEPIGPGSSVAQDDDTARLVAAALVSWISGHAVYVFHAGPGVRGGGAADLELGRRANFFDDPATARHLDALAAAQALVPGDVANWSPLGPADPTHPFGGEDDVYCASRQAEFVCAVFVVGEPRALRAASSMRVRVVDPATGSEIRNAMLEPGGALALARWPAVVALIGARTAGRGSR